MKQGLRETKRVAIRHALARTAYEMVLARGFDGVTVEEITAAIPVSRRTFSNYFANKEEAVATLPVALVKEHLADWSAPEDVAAPVRVALIVDHLLSCGVGEVLEEVFRIAREYPSFGPHARDALWAVWEEVGDHLRDSLGVESQEKRHQLAMVMGALYGLVSSRLQEEEDLTSTEIIGDSLEQVVGLLGPLLTTG